MIDSVIEQMKCLKLKNGALSLTELIERGQRENTPPLNLLKQLFDIELESRRQSRIIQRFKQSRLSEKLTIDQFDFEYHPSRKKQKNLILNLMSLDFLQEKKDIIFIGNPGVGKSFLAKSIAYQATLAGFKVLFTTAVDMINQLSASQADNSLLKKLHYYQSPDLVVVDEAGYLPLGPHGSNHFFQVISARHDKRSTIITTNLPFADWGKIFDSTTVATAIADRLVYRSEVLVLEGTSYRKRMKKN